MPRKLRVESPGALQRPPSPKARARPESSVGAAGARTWLRTTWIGLEELAGHGWPEREWLAAGQMNPPDPNAPPEQAPVPTLVVPLFPRAMVGMSH